MLNRFQAALAASLFSVSAIAPAFAVGPIQTTLNTYAQYQTFSATVTGLVPAASATDFFTLTGSATKLVTLKSIGCTGTSTAAASQPIQGIIRSTLDTAGTSTAPAVVSWNTANTASTAVVSAYTANPTLGTTTGGAFSGLLATVAPASTGTNGFYFTTGSTDNIQPITLTGATQQLALNAIGASFAAGTSLTCNVTWMER